MKRHYLKGLIIPFVSVAVTVSCVNEDYDLDKVNYDESSLLKGFVIPLGSSDKILLSDILPIDDEYFGTDEDGNYVLRLDHRHIENVFEVPEFAFKGFDEPNPHQTIVDSEFTIPQLTPGYVSPSKEISDIVYDIEIDQRDIPTEVNSVIYAEVDSRLVVKFMFDQNEFPFERIWLKAGTSINFPEWVILGEQPDLLEMTDNNTAILKEDVAITPSTTEIAVAIIALDFTKMPENQGIVSPGRFYVDDSVIVSGSMYVMSDDCTKAGTYQPVITSYLHMDRMEINYIEANLSVDMDVEPQVMKVEELPEFLTTSGSNLDFEEVRLNVQLANSFPIPSHFNATLSTKDGSGQTLWSGMIGPLAVSAPQDGQSEGITAYSISEAGTGAPEGYQNYELQDFNSIMKVIPDEIVVQDISISTDDEIARFIPGNSHHIDLDYDVIAPLSFGSELSFTYTHDIKDLGVAESDVELREVVVKMEAESTIPLDFALSAEVVDAQGNVVPDIKVSMDSVIKAGKEDAPVVSPIAVTLKCDGILEFDGIRLTLAATSGGESYTGLVLNRNQCLQLSKISLALPDGIIVKIDEE